jgi:hypothetical protein
VRFAIALAALLAWLIGWCCAPLHGAAWTQEAGQGQVIVNVSFLDSSHWFDPSGKLRSTGRKPTMESASSPPRFFALLLPFDRGAAALCGLLALWRLHLEYSGVNRAVSAA